MDPKDFHHLVINNAQEGILADNQYCEVAEPTLFEEAFQKGQVPFSNHNGNF